MSASSTSTTTPRKTLQKPDGTSPLLNLAVYPPTVHSLSTWTLAQPRVSIPSEWKQKSAIWREEQVQRIREEQGRYRQRWLVAASVARISRMRARAPAGDTTARVHPKRPVRFETPSARAILMGSDVPSARASSRTVNATPGASTGPRYFVRSKESWKQLIEHVHRYKTPQPSSQPSNDGASCSSPTVIQQSTEKRRKRLPLFLELGEGEGGDEAEGGEDHQQSSRRAKRCKGE